MRLCVCFPYLDLLIGWRFTDFTKVNHHQTALCLVFFLRLCFDHIPAFFIRRRMTVWTPRIENGQCTWKVCTDRCWKITFWILRKILTKSLEILGVHSLGCLWAKQYPGEYQSGPYMFDSITHIGSYRICGVVVSKMFYFYPYFGKMIQFDEHNFQFGWNHQVERIPLEQSFLEAGAS